MAQGGARIVFGRFRSAVFRHPHRVRSRLLRMLHQFIVHTNLLRFSRRFWMLVILMSYFCYQQYAIKVHFLV